MRLLPGKVDFQVSVHMDRVLFGGAWNPGTSERHSLVEREAWRQWTEGSQAAGLLASEVASVLEQVRGCLAGGPAGIAALAEAFTDLDPIERESKRRRLALAEVDTGGLVDSGPPGWWPGMFRGFGRGFILELPADEMGWCELWARESAAVGDDRSAWGELLKAAVVLDVGEQRAGTLWSALQDGHFRRSGVSKLRPFEVLRRAVFDDVDFHERHRFEELEGLSVARVSALQGATKGPVEDSVRASLSAREARRRLELAFRKNPAALEAVRLKHEGYRDREIVSIQGSAGPLRAARRAIQRLVSGQPVAVGVKRGAAKPPVKTSGKIRLFYGDCAWMRPTRGAYKQRVGDRWVYVPEGIPDDL